MLTNPLNANPPERDDLHHAADAEHPGYETTDVNVGGVIVFLAGLLGFVIIFFVFCFGMGKVINTALEKQDGPADRFHSNIIFEGAPAKGGKREDLASNNEMVQKQLQQMTAAFPGPRLETDDGNQDTADLHAREDLLLDHYSKVSGETGIRIPIERAMELIAEKGLPVAPAVETVQLAGDAKPVVLAPLTTGFARTGYELDVMEAREQKLSYGKAEAGTQLQAANK
jgi:hypothetical protein